VTSTYPVQAPRSGAVSNFWIYAQFALIGVTTVLLGPILPSLATHWGLQDLQSGYFFAAQYLGSTLGSLISTWILPSWGFARVCSLAMLILSLGLVLFLAGTWRLGLFGIGLCGLGMALAIAASNLGVAASNPGRAAAAVSLLNFAWGAGAFACPFLIGAGLRYVSLTHLIPVLGIAPLFLAIRFATMASPGQNVKATASPWSLNTFLIITFIAFLYVGTENAVGGWIASYAKTLTFVTPTIAAITPSAFWGALLLGRGLAPAVLRAHSERTIFRLGLVAAMLGTTVVLTTHAVTVLVAGAAIAGLGLAAVFPITVAVLTRELGPNSSRLGGFFFAIGNLGGATIPFLVGAVSTHMGSLRVGLLLPLVATGLILTTSAAYNDRLAFAHGELNSR
jgi:FHS family glucose/mannose:H+ symporter-like MFS transporter